MIWPFTDNFTCRFLGSYSSTALSYPERSADEGSLHEVEFISPYTVDTGESVFLMGYIWEKEEALDWRSLLGHLQLGAERCYGWGRVEPASVSAIDNPTAIFGTVVVEDITPDRPVVHLDASQAILAHVPVQDLPAEGTIEPLVGREWRSNNPKNQYAGQHVEFAGVYFQPGSRLLKRKSFQVGHFGLWLPTP